jgi:hypothetical protein
MQNTTEDDKQKTSGGLKKPKRGQHVTPCNDTQYPDMRTDPTKQTRSHGPTSGAIMTWNEASSPPQTTTKPKMNEPPEMQVTTKKTRRNN